MIKQKHEQRWWQDAIMAFITVITAIVHAMTSRDFHGWEQGGANLLPPKINSTSQIEPIANANIKKNSC